MAMPTTRCTTWERGRERPPGILVRFVVVLCVMGPQVGQAQSWPDEYASGPFTYHADFPLQPYLPLIQSVSNLQYDVPHQLGLRAVREPIHVYLFEQARTYRSYLRKYFPDVPRRRALFVKQRGPGMVFAHLSKNFAVDLRHETTHAVLHSMLPMVPLWLDEGLGEYFELPVDMRAGKHQHLKTIRLHARLGRMTRLEKLESIGDLSRMRAEHYRDAWAWVHFMLHGPDEARAALQTYLRDLESHIPPGQLSHRIRRQIPNLHHQYVDHFRRWKP